MTAGGVTPLWRWLEEHARTVPVAVSAGGMCMPETFRARVRVGIDALRARAETRWLLSSESPLDFAAGFMAAMYAGKTVILPPNRQPGAVNELAAEAEGMLGGPPPEAWNLPWVAIDAGVGGRDTAGDDAPIPVDPERPSVEFFTSGSTGAPKKIVKSLRQLHAEIEVLEACWGEWLGGRTVYATVSHSHIYGLLFRVLWPLCAGRCFRGETHAYPEEMLADLRGEEEGGVLISSPAQLKVMPELIDLRELHRRCRVVFSSGGTLVPATADAFARAGSAPVEVLGSTETGGVAWRRRDGDNVRGLWTPFPGIGIEAGPEAAPLRIRSPYLPDPEAWYEMDDCARDAGAGRFELAGRRDRIIKIAEKRVSLDAVEQRLNGHAWVAASAVIVTEQASISRRRVLGALVVLNAAGKAALTRDGRRAMGRRLADHLRAHFEPVVLPRKWRYPDAIPVNAQGKRVLRELETYFAPAETVTQPAFSSLTADERQARATFSVPENLACLGDHFPGTPVVPGVALLGWIGDLGHRAFGCGTAAASLEAVKFHRVLRPGDAAEIALTWDPEARRLGYRVFHGDTEFAGGRMCLLPRPEEVGGA